MTHSTKNTASIALVKKLQFGTRPGLSMTFSFDDGIQLGVWPAKYTVLMNR